MVGAVEDGRLKLIGQFKCIKGSIINYVMQVGGHTFVWQRGVRNCD